jgi:hypothetical protein
MEIGNSVSFQEPHEVGCESYWICATNRGAQPQPQAGTITVAKKGDDAVAASAIQLARIVHTVLAREQNHRAVIAFVSVSCLQMQHNREREGCIYSAHFIPSWLTR